MPWRPRGNGASSFWQPGVFHYQPTDLMGALLPFLSGRFPGGTLFFDAVSSLGMRISNRYVARSGNRNAPMTFCIDKVPALASLSPVSPP